ncbi:MAG: hypothetical protein R3305_06290, partial [Gammaproteobacteria bacterium]|nr:hypothetical protein [Gammaproteobacteria bacterium]
VRDRYFLGAELTLLIRQIRLPGYREVSGGYGPRSFRYAEMIFGSSLKIAEIEAATPQQPIFAMRPRRAVSLDEVARATGLTIDEIRRFNPALVNRVPANANLYLPFPVAEFGEDTTFWHREPTPEYTDTFRDFLRLSERYDVADWQDGSVVGELRAFETRFKETATEEGTIMAVMLAYIAGELEEGRQIEILARFRSSERVARLLEHGVRRRAALLPRAEDAVGWAQRTALLTTSRLR